MRIVSIAVLMTGVVMLAGCKTAPVTQAPATQTSTASTDTSGYQGSSSQGGQQLTAEQLAKQELARVGMVVYFDYDSSDIKSEYSGVVAAHAKYLSSNSNLKVRLEGHADERGSREYNIGLGERRAQAVRRALLLQGVSEAQVTTLSYGEERPAVEGHDESAYSKNRRVEFGY
ncbi:MAG: peptidoglycan-associated lipoprotein Pal [Steroidobacteraceae bacterium]